MRVRPDKPTIVCKVSFESSSVHGFTIVFVTTSPNKISKINKNYALIDKLKDYKNSPEPVQSIISTIFGFPSIVFLM
jgi:hypothetical protein